MRDKHSSPGIVKVIRVDGGRSEALIQRWMAEQRTDLELVLEACESPIEAMFAVALFAARDGDGPFLRRVDPAAGDKPSPIARGRAGALYLQYPLILDGRAVRLDFAVVLGKKRLAIETDGHDFHERTKQQAASDKSRDRLLTAAGWKLLRFTGSEVYADAAKCAGETLAVVGCVMTRKAVSPAVTRVDSRIVPPRQAPSLIVASTGAGAALVAIADVPLPVNELQAGSGPGRSSLGIDAAQATAVAAWQVEREQVARDRAARKAAEQTTAGPLMGLAPLSPGMPAHSAAAGVLAKILAESDADELPIMRRPFVPRPRGR